MEQFARQYADQVTVVGLGTQDSLGQARDFVERFGLTHTMLWDASYQSWADLGVSLQPSAQLFSADGRQIGEWLGPFDEDEVLSLVAGSAPAEQARPTEVTGTYCRYVDRFARAQRDAAAYPTTTEAARRQRIVDDLRFGANAAAQTAPMDLAPVTEALAAAVRTHAEVFVASGSVTDPTVVPDTSVTAPALTAALAAAAGPLLSACGVTLELSATP